MDAAIVYYEMRSGDVVVLYGAGLKGETARTVRPSVR